MKCPCCEAVLDPFHQEAINNALQVSRTHGPQLDEESKQDYLCHRCYNRPKTLKTRTCAVANEI